MVGFVKSHEVASVTVTVFTVDLESLSASVSAAKPVEYSKV